jgi:hypothetical protein
MIEIPPYRHLAIVPLLAVALASIVAAAIVLHFAVPRFRRHRSPPMPQSVEGTSDQIGDAPRQHPALLRK